MPAIWPARMKSKEKCLEELLEFQEIAMGIKHLECLYRLENNILEEIKLLVISVLLRLY
jgi:hypothetical protein